MKSRTILLIAVAVLLIIAYTVVSIEAKECSTCEDVKLDAPVDPTCTEWVWVEVDGEGNPTNPGVTTTGGTGTSSGGTTTKNTVDDTENKNQGTNQGETDNSWWWKVLVALGSCVIGLTCIVAVVGVVVAVWWRKQQRVQEYSLFEGAFKSNNKKTIDGVITATDMDFTNAEDVSEYESDEYDDEDDFEDEEGEEENVNLGHDQVPAEEEEEGQVDSDGFESDEYDD
mmetsp:Transcript_3379/g.4986  ORF Transcript_3379/g.4986 Transcript_3379/m.4986 type:complete len:227 (-) Transcript_3379:130-810(-)